MKAHVPTSVMLADLPRMPRVIASRRIPAARFARVVHRIIPALRSVERLVHPRLRTPFEATKRAVGVVVLLLGATLVSPFPFSHVIPAFVIVLVSVAYLEEDGVLLCISPAAALVSLSITAATVRTAGLVDRLLLGI